MFRKNREALTVKNWLPISFPKTPQPADLSLSLF